MLSQEELYQLIFKEHWTKILDLFTHHKADIMSDPMLKQAATIFEQEFFKKLKDYPDSRTDIEDNLGMLYVLNHGKYYQLLPENYKILIIELVKRKSLTEAVNYARIFPDEKICRETISRYNKLRAIKKEVENTSPNILRKNWIEVYNRLFSLINDHDDAETYFSGSRFLNIVREFDPYFPDYTQFMSIRNRDGKSTSRKIYYYDILIGLGDEMRLKVINRILEILRPFQPESVEKIESLMGNVQVKDTPTANDKKEVHPKVFISYSWDNKEHKTWVLQLADRLRSDGVDVILDRYYLKAGKSIPHFVENAISEAERIIIIFTPNYKLKADNRDGGVGYEYSIMNAELYANQKTSERLIPMLRSGTMDESIPTFMTQFIHIDISNDEKFENSYSDLLREIYDEPEIKKPKMGSKPVFVERHSDDIEKPEIGVKPANSVLS